MNDLKNDESRVILFHNYMKTVAEFARKSDFNRCTYFVDTLSEFLFPLHGDKPVWVNKASIVFKTAVYAFVDYYLELEKEYIERVAAIDLDDSLIKSGVDVIWSGFTLSNLTVFFKYLITETLENPITQFKINAKSAKTYLESSTHATDSKTYFCQSPVVQKLIDATDVEYYSMFNYVKNCDVLWNHQSEMDLLYIYASKLCFKFNFKFTLTFSGCKEKNAIYNIVNNTLTVLNGWQPFDFKTVLSDRILSYEN